MDMDFLAIVLVFWHQVPVFVHSLEFAILPSGENESGKTTLISRLQGNEDPKKGSGLEYLYINVKDEYRDGEFDLLLLFYLNPFYITIK
jgi:hypothetical protein